MSRPIMKSFGLAVLFTCVVSPINSQETTRDPSTAPDKDLSQVPELTGEKPMSFWMATKLDFSKAILEDLTKGDFKKLVDDAKQMRLISKMEGFVRRKDENYRNQLHAFGLANQELIRQSERGNAEGATLAFNQLTTSCVACHALLREGEK